MILTQVLFFFKITTVLSSLKQNGKLIKLNSKKSLQTPQRNNFRWGLPQRKLPEYNDFHSTTRNNSRSVMATSVVGSAGTNFRISAKRVFLTYSRLPQEISTSFIIDQLEKKLSFDKYLIAAEEHQDGGLHYHILLYKNKKFNIKSQETLDIEFNGEFFHGNYQAVKSLKNVVRYVCKNEKYSTNFENIRDGELISMEEDLINHAQTNTVHQTIKHFIKDYPKQALRGINVKTAQRLLESLKLYPTEQKKSAHQKRLSLLNKVNVQLSNLRLPSQLTEWMKELQPTLLLVGDSGTGKTLFCKALAQEKELNFLQINHVDGLRKITQDHEMLVFDHFDFKNIRELQLLSLLNNEEDQSIRVSRGTVEKPKGLVQIVTLYPRQLKSLSEKLDKVELLSRIDIIELDQPILINLEVHKDRHIHEKARLARFLRNRKTIEKYCY